MNRLFLQLFVFIGIVISYAANVVVGQECNNGNANNGECVVESESSSLSSSEFESVRLGLEWFVNPDHLPLIVAKSHGIFEEFGLNVELVEPSDHWEAEEEIIQGRLDVAVTEPLHLAQDAAQGKDIIGFARFFHTDGGVMYRKDKVQRPADMCGLTISYPGSPGLGGPAIVNTMVQADGKSDCDINSYGKYNGGFFHTDALESGNADLATLIFWNFEIPEATARGLNVGFFSLKEWGVPDFCQLVLMTTPTKYQQKKNTLRKLILAIRRATGIIHQQPTLAMSYYEQYTKKNSSSTEEMTDIEKKIQQSTMQATLPAFPNDYSMSTEYYERLMAWLVETKQVDPEMANRVLIQNYWTNEIVW